MLWQHVAVIMNPFHSQQIFGMNQSLLLTHLLSPPSSSLPTPFCHHASSPLNLRLASDLSLSLFFSTPGYSSIATEATHGRLLSSFFFL